MIEEKRCWCCGDMKALSLFHRDNSRRDGRQKMCISCKAQYRKDHIVEIKIRDAIYRDARRDDKREKDRAYYHSNAEDRRRYAKEYKESHPVIARAHDMVELELITKRMVRPETCSSCGQRRKVDGHHDDYSKPLDVTWLCRLCHGKRHIEIRLHGVAVDPEDWRETK